MTTENLVFETFEDELMGSEVHREASPPMRVWADQLPALAEALILRRQLDQVFVVPVEPVKSR